MKNFGKCIIFSAPSGSGKTTLVKDLLNKADLNLSFSVSATTRNKRTGEVDGKDYFFKSKKEFNKLIKNDLLLEYEEVYKDIFYGTLKEEVYKLLKIQNVIFDIDVVGGIKLKKFFRLVIVYLIIFTYETKWFYINRTSSRCGNYWYSCCCRCCCI